MKFVHLSDLHIGKRLNEYSFIEDQKYIFIKILNVIDEEKPDAVFIAGDIYDKSVPSAEAVSLFDSFLSRLSERNLKVFVISGNHDSAERIAFGSKLMTRSGIYMSPVYTGEVEPVGIDDEFGRVNIYMLPFIKPINVRAVFQDESIVSYTDAVKYAVDKMGADYSQRNILISHQFVTGAEKCDSEEISIGGLDNVDASAYDGFDYVALGHIHGPQNIEGDSHIRYCGTPLKYSFSERAHVKSVTVGELGKKGELEIRTVPLVPEHDMVQIEGKYDEILEMRFSENLNTEDYYRIILTDDTEIPYAAFKLKSVFKNMMSLEYNNERTRNYSQSVIDAEAKMKAPLELFEEFFKSRNGIEMSQEQRKYMTELMEKIREESI